MAKYIKFLPKKMSSLLIGDDYINALSTASALVCPTESFFGDFIPAKIFEYAVSGAAILTNCNLTKYDMKDLNEVVIKYKDFKDLKRVIKSTDFSLYYGKGTEVMKNHTHKIRYKELFGD